MVVAGNAGVRLVGQRREGLTSLAYVIRWSEGGGCVGWLLGRGQPTLLTRERAPTDPRCRWSSFGAGVLIRLGVLGCCGIGSLASLAVAEFSV